MDLYIKDGGQWRAANPAKGVYVKEGGQWREASEIYIKDGGQWRKGYQKSDPVTYKFEAVATNSYRPSGWRGSNDLRVGSFADSNQPAGYGDHVGVMDFGTATDTNGSGLTYAQAIQARPVCTSAFLTLKRQSGTGYGTTLTGNTWYTGHTTQLGSGYVGMSTTYQVPTTGSAVNGPDQWSGGGLSMFAVDTDLAEDLQTKYIYVSNTQTLSSTGGYDDDYSALDGHLDTDPPELTVVLDFA